jgi:hypothetical protein
MNKKENNEIYSLGVLEAIGERSDVSQFYGSCSKGSWTLGQKVSCILNCRSTKWTRRV